MNEPSYSIDILTVAEWTAYECLDMRFETVPDEVTFPFCSQTLYSEAGFLYLSLLSR